MHAHPLAPNPCPVSWGLSCFLPFRALEGQSGGAVHAGQVGAEQAQAPGSLPCAPEVSLSGGRQNTASTVPPSAHAGQLPSRATFQGWAQLGGLAVLGVPLQHPLPQSRNPSHLFLMGAAAEPGVGRWRGPLSWRACPGTLTPPPHPTGPHLVLCLLSAQPLGSLQSEEWGAGTFLAQPLLWLPARAIPCQPPHKACMLGLLGRGSGGRLLPTPGFRAPPGVGGRRAAARRGGPGFRHPCLGASARPLPRSQEGRGHKHVPGRGSCPQLPGFRGAH